MGKLFINTSKLFCVAWMKGMGNTRPESRIWQVKTQAQVLLITVLTNSAIGVEVICIYTSLWEMRK